MLRHVFGDSAGSIGFDAIDDLVLNKTPESQVLDYKLLVSDNREFSRDVAAMANAGGGIIIIGVRDDNNLPVGIEPVPIAGEASRLEQVLGANVQPFVRSRIRELPEQADESKGVLLVEILPSGRVPHAVSEGGGRYGYYIRSGQHRFPMAEADIERLYRSRFQTSEDIQTRLARVAYRAREFRVAGTVPARIYIAGTPVVPEVRLFRPTRSTIEELEQLRRQWSALVNQSRGVIIPLYVAPEFKRLVFTSTYDRDAMHMRESGWREFHDDGSYLGVVTGHLAEIPQSGPGTTFVDTIVVVEVIALLAMFGVLAQHFQLAGDVEVRAGIRCLTTRTAFCYDPDRTFELEYFFLNEDVETTLTVEVTDLLPGPSLLQACKVLLDDLATAVGWKECYQLSERGEFRFPYVGRRWKPHLELWTARFGIGWTDEKVT